MKNNPAPGMTLIVKTITRLTVGLILIYGIYITLKGHLSPGGGFAGGIIIALSFIHLMLAFGKDAVLKKINESKGLLLASTGITGFLILFISNLSSERNQVMLENNFGILSEGVFSLCDIVIALTVSCGLFTIFLSLILFVSNGRKR